MKRKLTAALVCSVAMILPAAAALPNAPSVKPPVTYASKVVSTQDAATVRQALRAADEGKWAEVNRLQRQARDPVAADLILWRIATSDPTAGFDLLNTALERLEGWPRHSTIRARAEEAIAVSALSHRARADWLQASGPITGEGRVSLGISLTRTGERDLGGAMIREAWRSSALTPSRVREVLRDYRDLLSQDDHRARADYLVWTRQYSAARDLLPYLSSDWRALIEARIALALRQRGVDARIEAVPTALQNHPGLLYERAVWRRKARLADSAVNELLVEIDGALVPESGRGRLWDERHLALRVQIQDGDFREAYRLSVSHGMTSGVDFAEAEFIAGWLALRKNSDAPRALEHFKRLEAGVSSPISTSRANYWEGRAYEALRDTSSANEQYDDAAQYTFTYYGQLSAEKVGKDTILMPVQPVPTQAEREAFEDRPLVRAARLLGEAGENALYREVALFLDGQLTTEVDHLLLFQVGQDYQQPHIGLRGAKTGLANGIVATDAAYPLLSYQPTRTSRVEDALVVALSRQESELNPKAISSANARGLMQLLPSTARRQAALEGLPYRETWLTDDPAYNITLGSAHLADLIAQFNGSYVLAIAAYNAGASRSNRWIREFGDPRGGRVDAIDWVETIPFGETRNYVQRVLENTQVYRNRLTGQPAKITLSDDLKRGTPD